MLGQFKMCYFLIGTENPNKWLVNWMGWLSSIAKEWLLWNKHQLTRLFTWTVRELSKVNLHVFNEHLGSYLLSHKWITQSYKHLKCHKVWPNFERTLSKPIKLCNHVYLTCNRTELVRHHCRKTTVLSCHRCLINTGVEKMNNI